MCKTQLLFSRILPSDGRDTDMDTTKYMTVFVLVYLKDIWLDSDVTLRFHEYGCGCCIVCACVSVHTCVVSSYSEEGWDTPVRVSDVEAETFRIYSGSSMPCPVWPEERVCEGAGGKVVDEGGQKDQRQVVRGCGSLANDYRLFLIIKTSHPWGDISSF